MEDVKTINGSEVEQQNLPQLDTEIKEETTEFAAQVETLARPIFIGCPDHSIMPKIIEAVKAIDTPENYEIAVMSQDVLTASTKNWFMGKLSIEEQNRQSKERNDANRREQALKYAYELVEYWPHAITGFKEYDLKRYYNKERAYFTKNKHETVTFSNKDVANVLDFLKIHNIATPTLADVKPHKQIWVLTIQPTDRLTILNQLSNGMQNHIDEISARRNGVLLEIEKISAELLGDTTVPAAADEQIVEPQPKAKRGRPKKKSEA